MMLLSRACICVTVPTARLLFLFRSAPPRPLFLSAPPSSAIHSPFSARSRASSSSSSSSTRWKTRQANDSYGRSAKLAGLKSRAAFKLLEIHDKHRLFRRGDTVVDLGFAPGSWSQVAVNRTQPGGRVVGIDVIPAQPPRGASALQGNFLSREIQEGVKQFLADPARGRVRSGTIGEGEVTEEELEREDKGVVALAEEVEKEEEDAREGRLVNVVLSDMSEPWPLVASTWIKSVSNPYRRMLNTSGIAARDHGGSMDLCMAALSFAYDTLVTGGHFLCKFYTGAEDHAFELRLKKLFEKVHRIKPEATRKESKEAYFVALRRKAGVDREQVLTALGSGGR